MPSGVGTVVGQLCKNSARIEVAYMPWDQVLHKFKTGQLHSGSKTGPKVGNRKQAIAIMLSEKRKAGGKPEYRAKGVKLSSMKGK